MWAELSPPGPGKGQRSQPGEADPELTPLPLGAPPPFEMKMLLFSLRENGGVQRCPRVPKHMHELSQ